MTGLTQKKSTICTYIYTMACLWALGGNRSPWWKPTDTERPCKPAIFFLWDSSANHYTTCCWLWVFYDTGLLHHAILLEFYYAFQNSAGFLCTEHRIFYISVSIMIKWMLCVQHYKDVMKYSDCNSTCSALGQGQILEHELRTIWR